MICKLCLHDEKLVSAHIIPRSFFEIDPQELPRIASSTDGTFPKRAPIGIYDTNLLCEDCERLFSPFDDYAQRLLLVGRKTASPILYEGKPIAHIFDTYEYVKLKLFFLGLLWRASQSSHVFFQRINLGPHESVVREAFKNSDPGIPEFYSILLAKFPKPLGILDPHNERLTEVNFCRFYLAEYVAYIKIDNRPTPEPFTDFILKPEAPLLLLARDPQLSKDVGVMRGIAMKHAQFISGRR